MMKISMTIREIFDKDLWEKVCKIKGWDVWILNEGRATMDEEVTFDEKESKELFS